MCLGGGGGRVFPTIMTAGSYPIAQEGDQRIIVQLDLQPVPEVEDAPAGLRVPAVIVQLEHELSSLQYLPLESDLFFHITDGPHRLPCQTHKGSGC